ncbi:AtpZ/AtpI family protein [Tropicimonas sp. IMCC6043]|uniref:AtpZ/AtpI family protein n=1 Tax=Tropicimonas sp. IMCC6043 TaxID=2510645 RepID=UPI00101DB269|nr:AtpZ/AtpI family protein [Tropicimonas sp. IMCC6043]RYH07030.1 AtpZ/AtpI family protein [Tropicimonas sp. IMCC6043]
MTEDRTNKDHLAEAARRTERRERLSLEEPEPSLGARLGQIGILGWAIVTPILLGIVLGRMADQYFGTGIDLTAAAIFVGAIIGFHAAWKWMHKQ